MYSGGGWQALRGWLIHDSHDSLCGPLALVPASGRREAVSWFSHENLKVEISDWFWLGSSVGSPFVRDSVRSSRTLTHTFWLWQPVWFRRHSCTAGFTHWETPRQSSGLARKKNLIKHQLQQHWSFLYLLGMPPLSYSKPLCNLYLCLDFEYFCSVANY